MSIKGGTQGGVCRAFSELAMENIRGRIGGKTSKTYSLGMRTDLNSASTSTIVLRTRCT